MDDDDDDDDVCVCIFNFAFNLQKRYKCLSQYEDRIKTKLNFINDAMSMLED